MKRGEWLLEHDWFLHGSPVVLVPCLGVIYTTVDTSFEYMTS